MLQAARDAISDDHVKIPWDHFSEWLHCVCVVTFDLELGQALEFMYPKHVELSDAEKNNICYLAFPDSNSGCMGDTEYCFRIRRSCMSKKEPSLTDHICSKDCPITLLRDETHLYGYVYFRQVRNTTLRRGYYQKSVVLLSSLPYFKFFKDIADIIAPEYFDNGEPCLEAACHDIDQWPSPLPGQLLNLPLMGMILHVRIPTKQDKPDTHLMASSNNATSPTAMTLSSINEVDHSKSLNDILPHIQLLWELVLLGEPLVIMAPSPTACSNTVLALTSSISPLRYYCDYRPYFTIHDSEFKEYMTKVQEPPSVMIGVTNPFFTKSLQHWPHIVRIGEHGESSPGTQLSASDTKFKNTVKLKTLEPKTGIYTKYKPFLKKDKAFSKLLMRENGKRTDAAQSALLRRHFLELTQSFIIPLERYLAGLMPLQKCISPLKAPPSLKLFRPGEFIQRVENNGPQLTCRTKGDWIGLYKRFLRSVNFEYWLMKRRKEMETKVSSLHLKSLSEMDLVGWAKNKSEVEIVDMVLRLREKLKMVSSHQISVSTDIIENIHLQISKVKNILPEDLQKILETA